MMELVFVLSVATLIVPMLWVRLRNHILWRFRGILDIAVSAAFFVFVFLMIPAYSGYLT